MRLFCLVLFFLCSASVFAAPFEYLDQKVELRRIEILYFNTLLSDKNFLPLSDSTGGFGTVLSVDQVYKNKNTVVFLKLGLRPSDTSLLQKVITVADGLALHGITDRGTYFALYSKTASRLQLENLLKSEVARGEDVFHFFNQAYAQSCEGCAQESPVVRQAKAISAPLQPLTLAANIQQCAYTALATLGENAKNLPAQIQQGFIQFSKNPDLFWAEVVKQFNQASEVIAHLEEKSRELFAILQNADAAVVKELACGLAGAAMTSFVFGGGVAAIAKIGLLTTRLIGTFSKIKPVLTGANKTSATKAVHLALGCSI